MLTTIPKHTKIHIFSSFSLSYYEHAVQEDLICAHSDLLLRSKSTLQQTSSGDRISNNIKEPDLVLVAHDCNPAIGGLGHRDV